MRLLVRRFRENRRWWIKFADVWLIGEIFRDRFKYRYKFTVGAVDAGSVRTQCPALFYAEEMAFDIDQLRTKSPICTAEFGPNMGLSTES